MKLTIKNIFFISLFCFIGILIKIPFKANADIKDTVNRTLKQGSSITIKNTTNSYQYIYTNANPNNNIRFNYFLKDSDNTMRDFKMNQSDYIFLSSYQTVQIDLQSGDNLLLSIPVELVSSTTIENTPMHQEISIAPSETYFATNNSNNSIPIATSNAIDPNKITLDISNYQNDKLSLYTPENYLEYIYIYPNGSLKVKNTSNKHLKLYYPKYTTTFNKSSESTSKEIIINPKESYIIENLDSNGKYLYSSGINSSDSYFDAITYTSDGYIKDTYKDFNGTRVFYLYPNQKIKITPSNTKIKFSYPAEYNFNVSKTDIPALASVKLKKGENIKINIPSSKYYCIGFKKLNDDNVSYDYSIVYSSKNSYLYPNQTSTSYKDFLWGPNEIYVTLNEGSLLEVIIPAEVLPEFSYTQTKAIVYPIVKYNKTTEIDTSEFGSQYLNLKLPSNTSLDLVTIPTESNYPVNILNYAKEYNYNIYYSGYSQLNFSLNSPGETPIPILGLLEDKIKYHDRPAVNRYTIPPKGSIDIINCNAPKTAVKLNEVTNKFNVFLNNFTSNGDLNAFDLINSTDTTLYNLKNNQKMRVQNYSDTYPLSISVPSASNADIVNLAAPLPYEVSLNAAKSYTFKNINKKSVITINNTETYSYKITSPEGYLHSQGYSNSSLEIPANYTVTVSTITMPITFYVPGHIFSLTVDYDINKDNNIDILDISYVASKNNIKSDSPNYSSDCDLVKDGIIDIYDIIQIAKLLT